MLKYLLNQWIFLKQTKAGEQKAGTINLGDLPIKYYLILGSYSHFQVKFSYQFGDKKGFWL